MAQLAQVSLYTLKPIPPSRKRKSNERSRDDEDMVCYAMCSTVSKACRGLESEDNVRLRLVGREIEGVVQRIRLVYLKCDAVWWRIRKQRRYIMERRVHSNTNRLYKHVEARTCLLPN